MSTNHHTPYVDKIGATPGTTFTASQMGAPLAELDEAITANAADIAGKAAAAHDHDDKYFTETELSTPSSGAAVDWTNITNPPVLGTGDGDVVGPATNTDNKVPQWDGADSKTLKDGLVIATSIGSPGVDTSLATEKAVRDAITALPGAGDVDGPVSHAADYVPQWNATPDSKTLVEGFPITAVGKAFLDDATVADQRTTLGVDVVGFSIGYESGSKPAAGGIVTTRFPVGTTFAAGLTGWTYDGPAPTAQAVVSFKKGGVEFGTLTVGTDNTATFAAAAQISFTASVDVFAAVFPNPQDATWHGVSIMGKGVRS
jgi:hypothetical protein